MTQLPPIQTAPAPSYGTVDYYLMRFRRATTPQSLMIKVMGSLDALAADTDVTDRITVIRLRNVLRAEKKINEEKGW